MITTGKQLTTFITGLNGGATIDPTLLDVLVDTARATIEEERPWSVLKKFGALSDITEANLTNGLDVQAALPNFSRFYGDTPLTLIENGDVTARLSFYRQVPFENYLQYRNASGFFIFDDGGNQVFIMGTIPFAGTPYVNYIATSDAIDLASDATAWSPFPSRFLPILGYYAIGIFKGAVDYDAISRLMLPSNQAALAALKNAMEMWDNEKQQSALMLNDPGEIINGWRPGAINRYGE